MRMARAAQNKDRLLRWCFEATITSEAAITGQLELYERVMSTSWYAYPTALPQGDCLGFKCYAPNSGFLPEAPLEAYLTGLRNE